MVGSRVMADVTCMGYGVIILGISNWKYLCSHVYVLPKF